MNTKAFEELGLEGPILKVIEEQGFTSPTTVQQETIPCVLEGLDVIAESATGTGKTLAFGGPAIQMVEKGQGLQVLILTPTRELANQIYDNMKLYSKYKRLNLALVYGGVSIEPQINKLRKAEICITTPGRILDHIERKTVDLSKVSMLIMDEGDKMIEMGFIDDVERIMQRCPVDRQTLLFSATVGSDIINLAQNYMIDPIEIEVEPFVDPENLTEYYYQVSKNKKFALLKHLIDNDKDQHAMVFCNTRKIVDFVTENLKINKVGCEAIHGGFSQQKRNRTMKSFNDKKVGILVSTDVASRGLHIDDLTKVYNYDLPDTRKQYIHRIGRTARAGKKGEAITILTNHVKDMENYNNIFYDLGIDLEEKELPDLKSVRVRMNAMNNRRNDRNFSRDSRNNNSRERFTKYRNDRRGNGKSRRGYGSNTPRYDSRKFGTREKDNDSVQLR
jgi:ATP-dependent RNA helicase DeaD